MSILTTSDDNMRQAQQDYVDFDTKIKAVDHANLLHKLALFEAMKGNPEYILIMFFTMIMASGDEARGGFAGDGSSVTRDQENQLKEVAYEMKYANAYRDTVSEMKGWLEEGKSGTDVDPQKIIDDCEAMKKYLADDKFTKDAPPIFQNSKATFEKSLADIEAVCNTVKTDPDYQGKFSNLWKISQDPKNPKSTEAGGLIQQFTNSTDTLYSAVGIQQNVLNTQNQDIEANYKSFLSADTQAMKSFYSVIDNALQKMNVQ